jgi:hypothetical protein
MIEDLTKGGPGSGRKSGSGSNAHKDVDSKLIDTTRESAKPISDKEKEEEAKKMEELMEEQKHQENKHPRGGKDKSEQKRQEMKAEVKAAKDKFKGAELKEAIAKIKRKYFGTKVRVAKSQVIQELISRAQKDVEFAKALKIEIVKALSTGGAAYSNTLTGDFTQGQVFQSEELITTKKKKLKKEKES